MDTTFNTNQLTNAMGTNGGGNHTVNTSNVRKFKCANKSNANHVSTN